MRKVIRYPRRPRTHYHYASAGVVVGVSDEVVVWRGNKRGNQALVMRNKAGQYIVYSGYGMDDYGPCATLQEARTIAGAQPPRTRFSMG